MWIFSKGRHNKPATLLSELYSRYLFIVVLLIALLGLAQFQSIHEGLYTTGANSLTFAINDALSEPFVTEQIKAGRFVALAPKLLNLLALRGINVRILGANKQVLGERKSKYDPTDLTPFVSDSVMAQFSDDLGDIRGFQARAQTAVQPCQLQQVFDETLQTRRFALHRD